MFEMKVDLSGLAQVMEDIEPDWGMLSEAVVNAAEYVRQVWEAAVSGTVLPGMKGPIHDEKYAQALATGASLQFPAFLHAIVLPANYEDGARGVEEGYSAFDMKRGLLNGPKSKPVLDAKGNPTQYRYNTVPFRHYTPQVSSPISIQMKMPNEVYNQAKKLKRSVINPETGSVVWGESLDWNKTQITRPSPDLSKWDDYTHKTDIHHNMYRVGYEHQTQYLTFRRVSTPRTVMTKHGAKRVGSDPNSWIHPGITGNPVIQSVYNYCMPTVEKNLLDIARKAYGID